MLVLPVDSEHLHGVAPSPVENTAKGAILSGRLSLWRRIDCLTVARHLAESSRQLALTPVMRDCGTCEPYAVWSVKPKRTTVIVFWGCGCSRENGYMQSGAKAIWTDVGERCQLQLMRLKEASVTAGAVVSKVSLVWHLSGWLLPAVPSTVC